MMLSHRGHRKPQITAEKSGSQVQLPQVLASDDAEIKAHVAHDPGRVGSVRIADAQVLIEVLDAREEACERIHFRIKVSKTDPPGLCAQPVPIGAFRKGVNIQRPDKGKVVRHDRLLFKHRAGRLRAGHPQAGKGEEEKDTPGKAA